MELFPYQSEGARWLKDRRLALLADEMGLGKSAQAIRAADFIGANRVCVICPAVARTNWIREFKKFALLQRHFNAVFSRGAPPDHSSSIVISYDLAVHFSPEHWGKFDVLILDEGHYLKSIKTKRTQQVLGKKGYVRNAKKIWVLTGTPAPNHAGELWPLLYTFGFVPEPYDGFVQKYCTSIETAYGRQITGTRIAAIPELKRILSGVMLRRKTTEVLKDLPKMFFQDLVVDPEPDKIDFEFQTDPKFAREKEILANAFGGDSDFTPDQAMMLLEGLAGSISTLRRYVGLKKVGPICDIVGPELTNRDCDKVVLFACHNQVVQGLQHNLREFNPVVITGDTPHRQRDENIDAFQNDPDCRVFIGNIQAAGTAITLTAATQGIFVEQDWVPGNNAQAAKRLHRIGQTKPVFIRVASLANSFDEQVSNILMRKARELKELFDEKPLTPFSELNNVSGTNENS